MDNKLFIINILGIILIFAALFTIKYYYGANNNCKDTLKDCTAKLIKLNIDSAPLNFDLWQNANEIKKVSFEVENEGWSIGIVTCNNFFQKNYGITPYRCVLDVASTNYADLLNEPVWWDKGKTKGYCRCEYPLRD